MKSLLWGVLGLILLDVVITSPLQLPEAGAGIAKWVANWIDPTVPLITASTTSTSSTPTNPTPMPVLPPGLNPIPQPFPNPL